MLPSQQEINEDDTDKRWIRLKTPPGNITSNGDAIMINEHELIIVAPYNKYHNPQWGIYKYNVNLNEWTQFIKYPTNLDTFSLQYFRIAFNQETQKLYLYGNESKMIIFDLDLIDNNNPNQHTKIITNCNVKDSIYPCMLNIKDKIHLIGGYYNNKHLIWDDNDQSFEEIHNFEKYSEIGSSSAIYVPSKEIVLLFGGMDAVNVLKKIDYIFLYSLQTKEWKSIINDFNLYETRVILTRDEQNVIIVGGHDKNGAVNTIYNLDLHNSDKHEFVLKKCNNLHAPKPGKHHVIRTGGGIMDEMLVFGYIKQIYCLSQVLPKALIKEIFHWYNTETLHWIQEGHDSDHFAISVADVLQA